jgi:hypothetical protein
MTPNCRIAGCRRKPHARGLCQRHYDQERKIPGPTGAVETTGRKAKGAKPAVAAPPPESSGGDDKYCSVAGCTNPHHARGYCKSHYGQLRRRGRIEEPAPAKGGEVVTVNKERRLAEIMKRHEVLKKEIANIHKELESEADED